MPAAAAAAAVTSAWPYRLIEATTQWSGGHIARLYLQRGAMEFVIRAAATAAPEGN